MHGLLETFGFHRIKRNKDVIKKIYYMALKREIWI